MAALLVEGKQNLGQTEHALVSCMVLPIGEKNQSPSECGRTPDTKWLRSLEGGNAKLERILAKRDLEIDPLKEINGRNR